MTRPTAVTIIGIIGIVLAVLGLCGGLCGLAATPFAGTFAQMTPRINRFPRRNCFKTPPICA